MKVAAETSLDWLLGVSKTIASTEHQPNSTSVSMFEMYNALLLAYAMETSSAFVLDYTVSPSVTTLAAKIPPASMSRFPEMELPLLGVLPQLAS